MNISIIDKKMLHFFAELQGYFFLAGRSLLRMVRRPFYYREFAIQFDKLGFSSLFICILTGLFTGMVMALQALIQLKPFAATSYVGGMVAATMIKELGPVLTALMVAGRVGSAITAELGTMVVTEQVDAMRVEGTDIVQRLVVPRMKAMLLAMPLLTVVTDVIALMGGYIMSAGYGINLTMYINGLPQFMVFQDLIEGLAKPVFFGMIITMTSCHIGLNTRGGAEGVGNAAKQAVVLSSVLILMSDFFISKVFVAFR
ncbi:MAG: ABC transporter permease [Desulfobacteraceae bacterium]|nr:ABC transporter permease [Desulfobacteraceae bacterium]